MSDAKNPRRVARANVVVRRLRSVWLNCPAISPELLQISTIGELGLGFVPDGPLPDLKPGDILEGKIATGLTVARIRFRIVYNRPEIVGAEFVEPSDLLRGAIRLFFANELKTG
jgi:hypothetical protein